MEDFIQHKAELFYRGEADRDFALAQMCLCMDDPVYFINNYVYTYDPRTEDRELPFELYDFQKDLVARLVDAVVNKHDVLIEKPRDMGASFTCLATVLWGWRFHNWDARIGSRKEEYVDAKDVLDALFPKLRFMFYRLPKWMAPAGFNSRLHDTYMKLINPEGGVLVGEATNLHFGRGGRSNVTLFDEFAAWPCDSAAWESSADTTPSRWALSTLGEDVMCKYNVLRRKWLKECPERVVRLHWTMHPNKSQDWYDNEKTRRGVRDFAREIDCVESEAGGAVFDTFRHSIHIKRVSDVRELWRAGWIPREALDPHDARSSVLAVAAMSPDGQWMKVLRCAQLDGTSLDQTLEQIQEIRAQMGYPSPDRLVLDGKYGIRRHKSAFGEFTWESYFTAQGEPIELSYVDPGSVEYGHKILRDWLRFDDGPPRLTIDGVDADAIITAFERYSYDDKGKVRETYKDYIDVMRYLVTPGPPPQDFWKRNRKDAVPSWKELMDANQPVVTMKRPGIDDLRADEILEVGKFTNN